MPCKGNCKCVCGDKPEATVVCDMCGRANPEYCTERHCLEGRPFPLSDNQMSLLAD